MPKPFYYFLCELPYILFVITKFICKVVVYFGEYKYSLYNRQLRLNLEPVILSYIILWYVEQASHILGNGFVQSVLLVNPVKIGIKCQRPSKKTRPTRLTPSVEP